jgi:glucose/arabinose dehydrogenase
MLSETVATGLRNPLAVVADPTSHTTVFVVEQDGVIRVVRDGILRPEPFLDLRSAISSGGERGLLGLAFAPDYAESRRFFVNFTDRSGDTVIARFLRQIENPVAADATTRFDLLWPSGRRSIDQPFSNHNGGHLAFGPDGYLYVGLGDGGSGGDPMNHAQNPQSLLGKMLRLDVNVPDDDVRGYRVPEDNPFVDGDPVRALPEIWAFGLRNPWR